MAKHNLVTALAAALDSTPNPGQAPAAGPDLQAYAAGDALLTALRNSATGRDQIMQRRIGPLLDEPVS